MQAGQRGLAGTLERVRTSSPMVAISVRSLYCVVVAMPSEVSNPEERRALSLTLDSKQLGDGRDSQERRKDAQAILEQRSGPRLAETSSRHRQDARRLRPRRSRRARPARALLWSVHLELERHRQRGPLSGPVHVGKADDLGQSLRLLPVQYALQAQ